MQVAARRGAVRCDVDDVTNTLKLVIEVGDNACIVFDTKYSHDVCSQAASCEKVKRRCHTDWQARAGTYGSELSVVHLQYVDSNRDFCPVILNGRSRLPIRTLAHAEANGGNWSAPIGNAGAYPGADGVRPAPCRRSERPDRGNPKSRRFPERPFAEGELSNMPSSLGATPAAPGPTPLTQRSLYPLLWSRINLSSTSRQ